MLARSRRLATCTLALAIGSVAGTLTLRAQDVEDAQRLGLDEDVTLRFARPVPTRKVARLAAALEGQDARPSVDGVAFVPGRLLLDPATSRRVVVRPEALREYFQLDRGMDRTGADAAAERVLRRVERRGDLRALDEIDQGLRNLLGATAGTRLDDPQVSAALPPYGTTDPAHAALRRLTSGTDEGWAGYLEGDLDALARLSDGHAERFEHPFDAPRARPVSGSAYAHRTHRRVLVLRDRRSVSLVPDLPTTHDLAGTGFVADVTYGFRAPRGMTLRAATRGLTGDTLFRSGRLITFQTRASLPYFAGVDARTGPEPSAPRVVSITPPDGESRVDPTTDWEDPDDAFAVPHVARRPFSVRIRFSLPLDPREVDARYVHLTKTAAAVGGGAPVTVSESVEIDVELEQTRLGDVVALIHPRTNLDPDSRYEVRVETSVAGLDRTRLAEEFTATFETR